MTEHHRKSKTDKSPGAGGLEHDPLPFEQRYRRALDNPQLRRNLLNFQRSWGVSRESAFVAYGENPERGTTEPETRQDAHLPMAKGTAEFEAMRDRLAAIKDEVIERLPEYVDRFQRAAEERGVHVYRAADADAANRYVLELCRDRGIRHVVKSKTMVSEEIELNGVLEEHGIEAVETDLGEWIQQLAHERPSHMVMPAIHKSREEVADLLTRATGREVSREDIGEQVGVARRELRRDFLEAGLGVSGANALVAESGAVMFIENEGNARLVTTLPRVHVVLAGIEKLVPDYAAAMLQLRLLARSATGQGITSYTTFLSGPPDPGKEMHIVLLDNGRTAMREHPLIKEALRCIRCAACADVCPPYAVVGGHVFGHIYSGAIGLVNTSFHHGIEAAAGPQSLCVSCNACATVCPVGIPLPQQILAVRAQVVEEKGVPAPMGAAMELWSHPRAADLAMRAGAFASAPLRDGQFTRMGRSGATLIPTVHRLTSWRTPPALPRRPARDRLRKRKSYSGTRIESQARGLRVAYFIQCITDRLFPRMAWSIARLMDACGVEMVVPEQQHCCGLPALDAGVIELARRMARQTIEVLEKVKADYILTGGASCAVAILHDYERLFEGEPLWQVRASVLAERVIDFTTFMDTVARLKPGALARPNASFAPVTYHNFCQSANVLGIEDAPRRLITEVMGLELREMEESSVCCGFGGSTSVTRPEVAEHILARKLDNVLRTGARTLVTDNPGCIMHLRGGIDARRLPIHVLHIAELMAMCLPAPAQEL
ncbi:MAG TPA: LUD domain-containing protein [Chloroflexia bacterium]|nr:LUD domain-containing protein [Chloroflexia bacterium]